MLPPSRWIPTWVLTLKIRGIGDGPDESAELRRVEELYQFDPISLNQSVSESKLQKIRGFVINLWDANPKMKESLRDASPIGCEEEW